MLNFRMPDLQIPEMPDIPLLEHMDISVDEIRAMTDEDLLKLLAGEDDREGFLGLAMQQVITGELLRRSIAKGAKPHWSVLPSFWLLVTTVVLSLAALAVALFALPQAQTAFAQRKPSAQPSIAPPGLPTPAPLSQPAGAPAATATSK